MKQYSNKISLIKNSRGIYCLDTSIGCESGMKYTDGGCYGDCYASKSAKLYGYDFTKTILRHFVSRYHKREIINAINNIELDFVRIGCSGDPSENWEHAIDVLKVIENCNKQIVIITRHWTVLTDEQLKYLSRLNICINTSVSALDNQELINRSIEQYNRIKPHCKSVLRIISCDFNLDNETGKRLYDIQHSLFKNEDTLDTIFRPSKKNQFVVDGIINTKAGVFNGHKALLSKFNKKTFTGKCGNCQEMCGVKIANDNYNYTPNRKIISQGTLFKNK